MQTTEVKIGKLLDFINSETYSLFSPRPIPKSRAIFQANNPDTSTKNTLLPVIYGKFDKQAVPFTLKYLSIKLNNRINAALLLPDGNGDVIFT